VAERAPPQPTLPLRKNSSLGPLPSRWTWALGGITLFEGGVSKSTATIFARAGQRFIQPRPVTLFGEPIEWVDRTRYLEVTLDTRLTRSPHIDQMRKRTAQRMVMLGPLLNRKSDLSVRKGVLLYKQLIRLMMDYAFPAWRSAARSHVRRLQVLKSKCLSLATGVPWYVTGRYTRTWVFPSLPTTSEPRLRTSTQS